MASLPIDSSDHDLIARLGELITALDRRVTDVNRQGEAETVRSAAVLKRRAEARIAELESGGE